ncbi:hypothetical protein LY90DRAFT_510197 [Neocallimastix californiae]|uniref:Uncharacterized protein n=1 Tax=Neocallimastix californiae TaxID=1754190 RepID=A0A1Y2C3N0_9FUNG|nr:hypothetical protein LY90DRAFT_510197 [Neocallimastix californiae]|eukprot:ORY41497.1 hypothetical protein LY90DRAFT_510197 [Neocallimastix californiae]
MLIRVEEYVFLKKKCADGTKVKNECSGTNKLISCVSNQNKEELHLSTRNNIKWKVGAKEIIIIEAYLKNDKEEVMKYFVKDTDDDIKQIIMNTLYEIFQLNSIKRKINRN